MNIASIVPCNRFIEELIDEIKPQIRTLIEKCNSVRIHRFGDVK